MPFWFGRGVLSGIVTTTYPRWREGELLRWAEQLPTPPAFHPELLTVELADALVASCPTGAMVRVHRHLMVDLGSCTGCGRCMERGRGAVERSGSFELASRDRSRLVKSVAIRGTAAAENGPDGGGRR
ncbi:MAG: hypothetical protein ACYDH5_18635 [Acidimicrobiales bacterium]